MTRRTRLWLLSLCGSLVIAHAACIQDECHEPPPADEVLEEVRDGVDEAADAMQIDDAARATLRARARALGTKMLALRATRAPHKSALIDEFQSPQPDPKRARALVRKMAAPSVALYHEFVDLTHASIMERTPMQRAALVDHLREPYEPIEDSLLIKGAVRIAMGRIDATDEQRAAVDKLKAKYIRRLNALGRALHRDREAVFKAIVRPNPSAKPAHDAVDAGARRFYALTDQAIADGLAFHKTLSAEQRVKFNALLDRARTCPAKS